MPITFDPLPDIWLFFRGMLMISIRKGRKTCQVGILRDAPGHELRVEIRRHDEHGAHLLRAYNTGTLLENEFSLEVEGESTGVDLFDSGTFKRKESGNDPNDFRWLVDFEGQEVYKEAVKIDMDGFRSIFHINDGRFFTWCKSRDNFIVFKKKKANVIGPVATIVGAFIYLDRPDGEAVFRYGDDADLEIRPRENVVHSIVVDQGHPQVSGPMNQYPNDTVLFHQAIAGGKASNTRIRFGGDNTGVRPSSPAKAKKARAKDLASLDLFHIADRGDPGVICAEIMGDPAAACTLPRFGRTELKTSASRRRRSRRPDRKKGKG